MRKKLEQQQGLLDTPAEATESDFLESIARTIFRKGGGLLGELVNPTETGLDEGYLDDQGRLVVTEPLVRERNFRNWFGDSKVVDEEGNPLVVYHGTGGDIKRFDHNIAKDKEGRKRKLGLGAGKFYLTGMPETAGMFASNATRRKLGQSPNVIPSYVSIKNPITEENYRTRYEQLFKTQINNDQQTTKQRDQRIKKLDSILQKEGIDGIWEPYYSREGKLEDVGQIGVFEPTQIKSIYNRGTFDPEDPDILSYREEPIGLLSV